VFACDCWATLDKAGHGEQNHDAGLPEPRHHLRGNCERTYLDPWPEKKEQKESPGTCPEQLGESPQ
jgi:hypothetical protein